LYYGRLFFHCGYGSSLYKNSRLTYPSIVPILNINVVVGHGSDDGGYHAPYKSDIAGISALVLQIGDILRDIVQNSLYITFKKNYHRSGSFNFNLNTEY
jgi:hypothetical protein